MGETLDCDLCVIGAGSGGLSVAAGAAQLGLRTVIVERGRMGGDCLNYGCVPSKALLAAAHAAEAQRGSARFGIAAGEPRIDFAAVHAHVHGVIAAIAPQDSQARFEGLGCTVLRGDARFTAPREIAVGDRRVRAKYFVIATGSRAGVPPIPGLDAVPYLTNETLFDRTAAPAHLVVIGAGPIGIEMAQAHRRLGARVTVIDGAAMLGKDDPELVDIVRRRLAAEGVDIREHAKILRIDRGPEAAATGAEGQAAIAVRIERDGAAETIAGSHLLVAAGRVANVDGLGLEAAGIAYTKKGITVDAGLRSVSNRRVFAVGDCAGGPQFTHVAGYHAGIVVRRALFRLFWTRADLRALPWVTFTDPELAHVGLGEADARRRHGDIRVLRWPYAENDRAQAERATDGLVKVIATRRGRVLGASIAGRQAGELIHVWALAIQNRIPLARLAGYIAPYPTLGEISKRAAGSYFTPALFSARTRRLVRFLMRWP